jgi:hypothetical protein
LLAPRWTFVGIVSSLASLETRDLFLACSLANTTRHLLTLVAVRWAWSGVA